LSHELRTPLNAIGGYADLIDVGVAGPVTEAQRDYLGRIRGAQQLLLAIINDLLNYSRIEAGHVTYDIRPIPLDALVERGLAMVAPQAAEKGIAVEHERCEGVVALADEQKAEQIILNLLSNAVKFTESGGRVTARCALVEGRSAIQVIDTGPGIPREKWDAVFEPFVQLGRSLAAPAQGAGLGLAISRDLARAMHGDLVVDSTPGEGSTFTFTLPLA
jgi:signal transduction histidine kinase